MSTWSQGGAPFEGKRFLHDTLSVSHDTAPIHLSAILDHTRDTFYTVDSDNFRFLFHIQAMS